MWHMGDGWGWWMVMGWLWMAVFWGLALYGIYALTGGGSRRTRTDAGAPASARDILERRYAAGELSDEQFEQMQARLTARLGRDAAPYAADRASRN